MSMFARYCTLCVKRGRRNPPAPVHRSKVWAYCHDCYVEQFPAMSIKRGYIEAPPKTPKQPKERVVEVFVQASLFEKEDKFDIRKFGCGCQGLLP